MRRTASPTPTRTALPLPADVRWMNAAASAGYLLVAAGAALAAVLWLMRSPLFPIRAITLDGDLQRNSIPTIRANATPRLAGNFFSVNLQQGRAAFESVPWVRRAVVRRVWPDRLAVQLEEHRAAALWEGSADGSEGTGSDKLVNSFGEVFEANVGDVEDDDLPTLSGPDGSAAPMLAMVRRLQPALAGLDMRIERLRLSGRGSWRVELDSGGAIELGRGSEDEIAMRAERFVRTFAGATGKWHAPLDYADLRHSDGYAVRLRGVSTNVVATAGAAATAAARAPRPAARPVAKPAAKPAAN